jgi:hypothetical protein
VITHTIDEALEIIRMTHDVVDEKPLLVSIFGGGDDAGKHYFCKYAMEILQEGYKTMVSISDNNPGSYVLDNYHTLEYLFLNSKSNFSDPDKTHIDIWNKKMFYLTHRPADMNIFIYNPHFHNPDLDMASKNFDLIIENKRSREKKRLEPD